MDEIFKYPTSIWFAVSLLLFSFPHVTIWHTFCSRACYRLGIIDLLDLQNSKGNQEILIIAGAESGFFVLFFYVKIIYD